MMLTRLSAVMAAASLLFAGCGDLDEVTQETETQTGAPSPPADPSPSPTPTATSSPTAEMMVRYQHVTDGVRQQAADAMDDLFGNGGI